jgi:hypothetical protein
MRRKPMAWLQIQTKMGTMCHPCYRPDTRRHSIQLFLNSGSLTQRTMPYRCYKCVLYPPSPQEALYVASTLYLVLQRGLIIMSPYMAAVTGALSHMKNESTENSESVFTQKFYWAKVPISVFWAGLIPLDVSQTCDWPPIITYFLSISLQILSFNLHTECGLFTLALYFKSGDVQGHKLWVIQWWQ